jgi:hypothetical protein
MSSATALAKKPSSLTQRKKADVVSLPTTKAKRLTAKKFAGAMVVSSLLIVIAGQAMLAEGQLTLTKLQNRLTQIAVNLPATQLQVARAETPSKIVTAAEDTQHLEPSNLATQLEAVTLNTPLPVPTLGTPTPASPPASTPTSGKTNAPQTTIAPPSTGSVIPTGQTQSTPSVGQEAPVTPGVGIVAAPYVNESPTVTNSPQITSETSTQP